MYYFSFKTELTRLLLNSGYSEYEVKKVFKFINFIMEIKNKELRSKFYGEVMEMSAIKDYKLELTDFEEVALEIRDKKIEKERDKKIAQKLFKLGVDKEKISNSTDLLTSSRALSTICFISFLCAGFNSTLVMNITAVSSCILLPISFLTWLFS